MSQETPRLGLKIWEDYPELDKTVSECNLPRKIGFAKAEWKPQELTSLLSGMSLIPIKSIVLFGVSSEVLDRAQKRVWASGLNRKIHLKGDYSEESRKTLEEATKYNMGQSVTIVEGLDGELFTRNDLIIQEEEELVTVGGTETPMWETRVVNFDNAVSAIVEFSKTDRQIHKDLQKLLKR